VLGGVSAAAKMLPDTPEAIVTSAADHDCCPETGALPKAADECQASAGCAFKCFGFFGVIAEGVSLATQVPEARLALPGDPIRPPSTSPPFRPPRV